ncbi:hypothetical protein C8R44DRAFT_750254 [Mycena epipterygia]|nr:hypothetical protein C8R44DRAFT_750254 [Mycena epipterygia]
MPKKTKTESVNEFGFTKARCPLAGPTLRPDCQQNQMLALKAFSPAEREDIFRKTTRAMAATVMSHVPDYEQKVLESRDAMMNRRGGVLGLHWTPNCQPPTIVTHGWLDFLYYDLLLPFGPQKRRTFNVQVCLTGHPPQEAFDYVAEGVTVELWDMIGQSSVRVRVEDNPETYIGLGGDIFVITYPLQRRRFETCTTSSLQLPV